MSENDYTEDYLDKIFEARAAMKEMQDIGGYDEDYLDKIFEASSAATVLDDLGYSVDRSG